MNAPGSITEFVPTLVRRRRMVLAPEGEVDTAKKAVFLSELFQMGFQVSNPELYTDAVLDHYESLMETLGRMRGGRVAHVPLYAGFPNDVPDEGDYLLRRILGYVIKHSRWDVPGRELDTGFTIPEWLFDLDLFGADPVSQLQDKTLFLKAKWAQLKRRSEKPQSIIELSFARPEEAEEELQEWTKRCLSSKTSYPEEHGTEFLRVLATYGSLELTAKDLPFREHRALVSGVLWRAQDWDALQKVCEAPSDLLRLFADCTSSDISLSEPITFPKFNRKERRFVLSCLEQMKPPLLVEDQIHKYRKLWLKLERSLHSGEYAKLFPKTYLLFRKLQKGQTRPRFRELESALSQGERSGIQRALANLPGGVSLRRFAQALAAVPEAEQPTMLEELLPKVEAAQLKDQLMLRRVLERDGWAKQALILTKKGATQVIPREPKRLSEEFRATCVSTLEELLKSSATAKFKADSWAGKTVYIEPALSKWVVPLGLRSASDSLTVMGRGTRVPLGKKSTLRLFVYWKQRFRTTDLDLSAVTFDENCKCTGFVDWTRLSSHGIVHSGDIQSAPMGAAEFIDVNIEKLQNYRRSRYIASTVLRYCGDNFGAMECFSGWMMRDKPDADYKTFDIATVEQKFELVGQPTYALPFIVDLQEREVTWLDLSVYSLKQQAQVANTYERIEQLVEAGRDMAKWRPTVAQLAELHIKTRGAKATANRDKADLVFALDSKADYHPGDWSKILSELL